MGKVNSITKLEIAIFVFLTMMISGASSIASNDFIRIIVVGLLALYSFINHKNLYNNILLRQNVRNTVLQSSFCVSL